jgi:hypothetical protein
MAEAASVPSIAFQVMPDLEVESIQAFACEEKGSDSRQQTPTEKSSCLPQTKSTLERSCGDQFVQQATVSTSFLQKCPQLYFSGQVLKVEADGFFQRFIDAQSLEYELRLAPASGTQG